MIASQQVIIEHMYILELSLKANRVLTEEEDELISDLLSSLRQNGQVIGHELNGIETDTEVKYFLLCHEKTSLSVKNQNKWVAKYRKELEKSTGAKIKVRVLGDAHDSGMGSCRCKPKSYILFATFISQCSPLRCGECFTPVPLYKVPKTYDESEYYNILCWESVYQSCDTLQMQCTVGEKFGIKQMSDINSPLSQQGLEVCKKIKEVTGKPTYYFLLNYRKIKPEEDKKRKCPGCGGKWLLKKRFHKKFDFKCNKCHLLSMLSYKL
jgi:predicted  nucleic acid-binding Zn ribbon protein